MRFFCLNYEGNENLVRLLKTACDKFSLEFVLLNPTDINCIQESKITTKDLFYRISIPTHPGVNEAELNIISQKPASFYTDFQTFIAKSPKASYFHQQEGLPCPKNITNAYNLSTKKAQKSAEFLGGFPLIIKALGHSKGIGVMKVESLESLLSVTQFLESQNIKFNLQEYIKVGKPPHSLRSVVLGDQVVFSYKNQSLDSNEFRSNVDQKKRSRTQIEISPQEETSIVAAVHSLGLELGGVDFVRDQRGDLKIFEVNFPFNFVPIVEDLGFPIHEKIVSFLKEKATS